MDLQHMENGISGGGHGAGVGPTGGFSENDFQRLAQTIATSIQKILQNVSTMQRMVNQFNTPQDSPDLKKQLHQIMTYTHQLVSDTNNQLKEVDKCKERHLKIQRDRLVDEFTAALTAFQAVQRKTVDIEKNAVRQARAHSYNISKPPGTNNSSGSGGTSGSNNSGSFFEDNFFSRRSNQSQQQTQMQEEIDLQALEEQERQIRELEENIVGVNEIYKKLGAMVYEQGLTVDSIESSVEQTSVFVSQGADNLRKASSYKNQVRRKKLILVGILSVVLFIIIMILVFEFKQ
ncbi:PREDICTED: syntaxin-7 [Rhagoletis zephyria]|uniref:syntaxin-7 n=1 Tax=Rhagoletis zephyria TaxID=28612 RepID=UPI0008119EB7|nr:PREDICTED: syntaxin-7 [Rhagoletis zephyria]XP_017479920.1 PREDICTED: syntaxin-7 [Rhagoletis zephyria]XP_036345308.1 syntaxin-7-like [Rhagoletis pomonella]XP_036345309.1 syntaxin-7-like [Rhagoletis pomonella]XP_036345310.1 syntaxin-7-like [Rhagoletis pomonella]XP_036345318.1 syntaxin-7-like [Rhagoletis pomonella]XP_036345319.1 syntaxin-7-like [Rhagoletis pomonella]